MLKKLTQKEREEFVTKGHLEDQNFVTKQYLQDQNFVTKDYLNEVLECRFEKSQKEYFAHLQALMEDYHGRIYTLVELFEARFERIEHRLDVLEA
jgi:hypothetical protein